MNNARPETWSDERIQVEARKVFGKAITLMSAELDKAGTQALSYEKLEALAAVCVAASNEIPAPEESSSGPDFSGD